MEHSSFGYGLFRATIEQQYQRMRKYCRRLIGAALLAASIGLSRAAAPRVVNVTPPSGSQTALLVEFTVAFDQPVSGVDAADLVVNGKPATAVNGSGTVYTFSFPQPNYGSVEIKFAS